MKKLYQCQLLLVLSLMTFSPLIKADVWTESFRLESLSQYDLALKALEPIFKKSPDNEFTTLRMGWLSYMSGRHSKSIKFYQQALLLNPKSLDAQLGLLLPLLAQQRWAEVEKYASAVLDMAPWNYYAHIRLMIAEEGQGKWQALAKHANAVHLRYPSDTSALVYEARAHRWMRDIKSARKKYSLVLQRYPGHIEALQFLAENK